MNLYIKVRDGIITDARFKTFGCGAAIASSSMLTDLIKGKPVKEALNLSNRAVVEALDGLPPRKVHCSLLAEDALKGALKDYFTRNHMEEDLRRLAESSGEERDPANPWTPKVVSGEGEEEREA